MWFNTPSSIVSKAIFRRFDLFFIGELGYVRPPMDKVYIAQ